MNNDYREMVDKAIEVFNRYRSPEVTAKLIRLEGEELEIEFSGPYCRTCGYYDYFDDFVIEAGDIGLNIEIESIEDMEDYAVVRFRVKGIRRIE